MIRSIGRCSCAVLLLSISSAWAWAFEFGRPALANRSAEQLLPPPFQLTSDQQKEIDWLLDRWHKWNSRLKTFDCRFKRWTYDAVFGSPTQPKFVDFGVIKYAVPNRVLFRVDATEKDGKPTPIDDCRAEHFVFDGKSLFEFNYRKKILIAHKLPTEFERNHLVDGPLGFGVVGALFSSFFFGSPLEPYPFGAEATKLRQRYYLRTITPPDRPDQIWMEAYPRSRQIAIRHQKIQLIFAASEMLPVALKIVQPNGKDFTVYEFHDIVINSVQSRAKDDPFRPMVSSGWQKIIEEPPPATQTGHIDGDRPSCRVAGVSAD